ncbi:MAG: DGQHR domain-containing protein [Candidatus Dojkabacteria bacterium]|jgi:DGQHR domain-containing protein|nr:DGQHR domain-containing protein [Candidatus Dojkabacteria bacterium]
MKSYKIKALRIYQKEDRANGQAIYSGKIQAVDLINAEDESEERFTPDYWTSEKKLEPGYQRPLNQTNIEKIKNYVIDETDFPLFPTSVVVNSRTPIKFREIDNSYGELEISNPLFVIDGQHRIEAFKELMKEPKLRGEYGTYEIPIVVLSGFNYVRELEQFFVINSRQTRIKFDLAQRMYMEMMKADFSTKLVPESKRWQTLAAKAVDVLNEESSTVWFGTIQLPDDSKDIIKTRIITQNSFISSLKPFFSGGKRVWNFNALPEKKHHETLEELTKLLTKFWDMVGEVYPQIINNPRRYTLLKTVGVYSLHIFLADVIADTQVFNTNIIVENAKKKLIKAKEQYGFTEVFWEIGSRDENDRRRKASGFSSSAGHNRIASALFSGRSVDQI